MQKITQKVVDYYGAARHGAQRRKSQWNILLILFCFAAGLGIRYGLFGLVWLFHISLYPEHKLSAFWQEDISFRSFVPSFLMVFPLAPVALIISLMLGNVLLWFVTPVRRIFDAEARGYPGASFQESMRGLFRACVWVLPIGFFIAFSAAYFLRSLR